MYFFQICWRLSSQYLVVYIYLQAQISLYSYARIVPVIAANIKNSYIHIFRILSFKQWINTPTGKMSKQRIVLWRPDQVLPANIIVMCFVCRINSENKTFYTNVLSSSFYGTIIVLWKLVVVDVARIFQNVVKLNKVWKPLVANGHVHVEVLPTAVKAWVAIRN